MCVFVGIFKMDFSIVSTKANDSQSVFITFALVSPC